MNRQFDDILLGSIELFCLAAEAGTFTGAANTAGVTPAAVSRSIFRLEKRLGVRLFVRSTRSIRLTEGGKSYFEQSRAALNQLIEAERKVTGEQIQPSGTLRISAPTTYGHHRLLPLLPLFRAKYPKIKLEVHISNRNIDFHVENFDLAIRFRSPPDSTLIARHLEDATLVVVASPDYLRRAGTPRGDAASATGSTTVQQPIRRLPRPAPDRYRRVRSSRTGEGRLL
jgi:DNA-binding transcriptional LysR family regulator